MAVGSFSHLHPSTLLFSALFRPSSHPVRLFSLICIRLRCCFRHISAFCSRRRCTLWTTLEDVSRRFIVSHGHHIMFNGWRATAQPCNIAAADVYAQHARYACASHILSVISHIGILAKRECTCIPLPAHLRTCRPWRAASIPTNPPLDCLHAPNRLPIAQKGGAVVPRNTHDAESQIGVAPQDSWRKSRPQLSHGGLNRGDAPICAHSAPC